MAKKKKAQQSKQATVVSTPDSDSDTSFEALLSALVISGRQTAKKAKSKKPADYVEQWNDYFQKGELEDFQRLCGDLGLDDDLPSKTQCRLALKKVFVNIPQFLECDNKPEGVIMFKHRGALINYTLKNKKMFPKKSIPKGSPLRDLLRIITG